MKTEDIKNQIEDSITAFSIGNLTQNSMHLFQTLGYNTERSAHLAKPDFKTFKESYFSNKFNFSYRDGFPNETKSFVSDWNYVDLLFQLSKTEV
jgi:hypothetical protein